MLGFIAGSLIAAAVIVRMTSSRDRHSRTLSRLEGKLDALLKHEGIQFDPFSGAPPAVLDALRRGKKIEAIKAYRAATGADLKEAKDYVEELERRAR
ncbi:MAG TPA: ribosomal protein L7/L12 [Vicinamibacterales bacterium]|nr:ribosomal protein L7/L12 [Vicinamibacterales bacterium]